LGSAADIGSFVSVIVPVYEEERSLERCLRSLEAQAWPDDRYEVIVVDNGNTEELAPRVASFPHVEVVSEERPGSFAARNRGVAASRGDVLAFIDCDCIADSGWIQGGVEALRRQGEGVIAGEVDMFVENPERTTMWDLHDLAWGVPQRDLVEKLQCAATANAFTTRAVFDELGGFEPSIFSGGDREFGIRAVRAGYPMSVAEKARVRHPTRSSFRAFLARRRRITGGLYQLKLILDAKYPGHDYDVPSKLRHSLWRAFVRDPGHPQVRTRWNRLRFGVAEMTLYFIKLVEMRRLKLGGRPLRK
jgi:glycosyltransferase involved in cell wall biosynthesis